MNGASPPAGYLRFDEPGAIIVARADIADAIHAAYLRAPRGRQTLHGYASEVVGARQLQGRQTAYALPLPDSNRSIVVRHNRHGGALRTLTGDVFRRPTRAPEELNIALRLERLSLPTPPVLAYAVYPAGFGFARSDVVTEEIPGASDLGKLILSTRPGTDDRRHIITAALRLVHRLGERGVRHHDLNVKNLLLSGPDQTGAWTAYVLDVDRVEFGLPPSAAIAMNMKRLLRSVEKWRREHGAEVSAPEFDGVAPE